MTPFKGLYTIRGLEGTPVHHSRAGGFESFARQLFDVSAALSLVKMSLRQRGRIAAGQRCQVVILSADFYSKRPMAEFVLI